MATFRAYNLHVASAYHIEWDALGGSWPMQPVGLAQDTTCTPNIHPVAGYMPITTPFGRRWDSSAAICHSWRSITLINVKIGIPPGR